MPQLKSKAPAFQFYAKEFLSGTTTLSIAEVGAYIRLLAWSWDNGPLPTDHNQLARICNVPRAQFLRIWGGISHKWTITETGWLNPRLEDQREDLDRYCDEQRKRGIASGKARIAKLGAISSVGMNSGSSPVRTGSEPDVNRTRTLPSAICILPSSEDQERGGAQNAPPPTPPPKHANPHFASTNLINGREQRRHGEHFFCGRVCVTYPQHEDFKVKGLKSDAELKAWYAEVMGRYDGKPIGDDSFAFWRNEFGAWVGLVTSRPAAPKSDSLSALADRMRAKGYK